MPNQTDPTRWRLAVLLAPLLLGAAGPRAAEPLVIDCYVVQSDGTSAGSFVRHLEIDRARGVVSIADSIGGGQIRFVGNGRLVALDAGRIAYDFASRLSSGRTEIDRHSGAFTYDDGRAVIRGSCQPTGM